MYKSLVITPELRLHLELLACNMPEYASDLIMALCEVINGEKQDPDEMPYPVRRCFLYWMNGNLASIIKVE